MTTVRTLDESDIPGTSIAGDSRVLWIIANAEHSITTSNLADILECERSLAYQGLSRLHDQGYVTRVDVGRIRQARYEYTLAGPGDTCECSRCTDGDST